MFPLGLMKRPGGSFEGTIYIHVYIYIYISCTKKAHFLCSISDVRVCYLMSGSVIRTTDTLLITLAITAVSRNQPHAEHHARACSVQQLVFLPPRTERSNQGTHHGLCQCVLLEVQDPRIHEQEVKSLILTFKKDFNQDRQGTTSTHGAEGNTHHPFDTTSGPITTPHAGRGHGTMQGG